MDPVKILFVSLAAICFVGAGCSDSDDEIVASTPTVAPSATPVPPPAENGYQTIQILPQAKFERMISYSLLPDGSNEALLATQGGLIYRVPLEGSGTPAVLGDISNLLDPGRGDEEGLLGMAVSPDFARDGRIFVNYSAADPQRSVLARFQVVDGALDPNSRRVVLEVEQPTSINIAGGLAFGPDGYLYWALGDGGPEGDPNQNGQKLSALLSSILRLDVSGDAYTVPPDNPFVNLPGARPEKYAYGLRNPWGFSFDSETGHLWTGDVGDSSWEEVNRVVAGGNYGWSIKEGFACYAVADCEEDGLIPPRAVYGHDAGCAVVGGQVYRGELMPELRGWFLYGDYCSGTIWAVDTTTTEPPVRIAESGQSIVAFGQLPDGEIILITFDKAILKLQRRP